MLTQARLKELLDYDTSTGQFWWKVNRGPIHVGQAAGQLHSVGPCQYIRICVDYQRFYAHQLAWLFVHGFIPPEIDHWDGEGTHNWLGNLRVATRSQNNANASLSPTPAFRGAYFDPRRTRHQWFAKIQVNGKAIYLGAFDSAEEAAEAYRCAAERYFGEFAHHTRTSADEV